MRAVAFALLLAACGKPELPLIAQVADFSLTDQNGKPFGSAELRGTVWIANFIFTRCTTVCPLFTEKMARLEQQAEPGIRFVSFSVDPEYDQPPVLLAYARGKDLRLARWSFLTGPIDAVKKTVVDGLKISMDKVPGAEPGVSVDHGTYFVLVDGSLRIRGIYPMSDDEAGRRLLSDAARL